jgi:hypothetical protein
MGLGRNKRHFLSFVGTRLSESRLCQNKFVKLVHLIGFIIKKCYDARSYERKQKYKYKYTFPISLHPRFVKTAQQATSRQAPSRSTDQDISLLLSTNYTAASTLGPRAHIQCVSFTLALLSVMYGWMKALYVIICCERRDDKPEIPYN